MTAFAVNPEALKDAVATVLGDRVRQMAVRHGELTLVVGAEHYLEVALLLRDTPGCQFEQLMDLCGVDYSEYAAPTSNTARYCVVSHLLSVTLNQRLRLKVSYVITNTWTTEEKAVLLALKKYGALVADNGNYFSISVTPDDRWPAGCFNHLTSVAVTNFEVVQSTGPNEGPRSAGAPMANAGAAARARSARVGEELRRVAVARGGGARPPLPARMIATPHAVPAWLFRPR